MTEEIPKKYTKEFYQITEICISVVWPHTTQFKSLSPASTFWTAVEREGAEKAQNRKDSSTLRECSQMELYL